MLVAERRRSVATVKRVLRRIRAIRAGAGEDQLNYLCLLQRWKTRRESQFVRHSACEAHEADRSLRRYKAKLCNYRLEKANQS